MDSAARFLDPSEAAGRLGVSAKTLRIWEQRGLIAPTRTLAGWRAYGPDEMKRGGEIVTLRALGLSLGQVGRVLGGDIRDLEPALAEHQAVLEGQCRHLLGTLEKVRRLREDLGEGRSPEIGDLARVREPDALAHPCVAFDLPPPWGGERFALPNIRPLNYIVGPLGSGKTRLAMRIADTCPGAAFLGLERLEEGGVAARRLIQTDPGLGSRVDRALAWLVENGATASDALVALLAGLEAEGPAVLVVDMLEQGLDAPTQEAVIANLRRRGSGARALFFLTRSSAILDLDTVGADEAIILCPANHSPPTRVAPIRGTPGYESVETCLATPAVRARCEGVIAWRPPPTPDCTITASW